VLVMAKEENLRKNRLALLQAIASLFGSIADFSKISV
jgi:glycyl-tRNA synthetase beta subunit